MPFTGTVDVSGILANLGDPDHGLKAAVPAENTATQYEDHIYRATWGQVDMSTQTALERAWDLIWDVNGYYRALGIQWPYKAGRSDLRAAYQERNGQDSEYLTYVIKQLLTPDVRSYYDKLPLGGRLRDKYVIEQENRLLSVTAKEMSEREGIVTTVDELAADIQREHQERAEIEELKPLNNNWEWGYFLLKTRKTEYDELIRWQEYLTRSFASRGLVKVISIGYIGGTSKPFVIKTWEGKTVIFLNDEVTPTMELAETVVSLIAPDPKGTE